MPTEIPHGEECKKRVARLYKINFSVRQRASINTLPIGRECVMELYDFPSIRTYGCSRNTGLRFQLMLEILKKFSYVFSISKRTMLQVKLLCCSVWYLDTYLVLEYL